MHSLPAFACAPHRAPGPRLLFLSFRDRTTYLSARLYTVPADGGATPAVVVENSPSDWRRGRDPQLECAVRLALEQLKRNLPAPVRRPKYPVYR